MRATCGSCSRTWGLVKLWDDREKEAGETLFEARTRQRRLLADALTGEALEHATHHENPMVCIAFKEEKA